MKKLTIGSLLVLISTILAAPHAIAETRLAQMEEPNDTKIEKYENMTETEEMPTEQSSMGNSEMNAYDVRRTEAFNLVSSAYRGDLEEQGISSYAVLVSNYESGDLTAEKLVEAAIEAGDLSPSAMEDESYINAVELQLNALTES